jgi:hypothetical protein
MFLFRKRPILDKKPGRVAKITEPMNAVELAEIADLGDVTGGCSRCGCSQPDPQQQNAALNPFQRR